MSIGTIDFWSFLLVFTRVTALFVTAPVFGNRAIPAHVKVGLAVLISLALRPLVAPSVAAPADLFSLISQLAAETGIGLCLGFMVMLMFAALEIAGHYIDTQMGFGMINILNPISEQQSSALGQLMYQLGMTIFLIAGGHIYLLGTLASSFNTVAAGGAHFGGDVSGSFISIVGQMFYLAFKIAAPAAAVLMIMDIAFGIVARTMPQMNVFIVGMPAKIILGLTTVSLALPVLALVVTDHMIPMIGDAAKAVLTAAR